MVGTTKSVLIQFAVYFVAIFVIPIMAALLAIGGLLFGMFAVAMAPFVLACALLGRWGLRLGQSHRNETDRPVASIPGSASSQECRRTATPTEQRKPE